MIELTDKIQRAYAEAWFRTFGFGEDDVQRQVAAELADPMPWRIAALQAVLAIVERDYLRVDGVHRDGRVCRPGNRCVYCTAPDVTVGPDR